MTAVDRLLQRWRFRKVRPFLTAQTRVLDIGSADGALFRYHPDVAAYVGIDPDAAQAGPLGRGARLVRGHFPQAIEGEPPFDVIAMLAVLEHVPPEAQSPLAAACHAYLRPQGHLVVTVPSPAVDRILDVLAALRLIHGMAMEQHYGFGVSQTPAIFERPDFQLRQADTFQLGLNHLFVFQKAG